MPERRASENAAAILRLLLDHGADPNAFYLGGNADIHYTALTSVLGRGEELASMHPHAREPRVTARRPRLSGSSPSMNSSEHASRWTAAASKCCSPSTVSTCATTVRCLRWWSVIAERTRRTTQGLSAADIARRRGLEEAATLLRVKAASG